MTIELSFKVREKIVSEVSVCRVLTNEKRKLEKKICVTLRIINEKQYVTIFFFCI